MRQINKKIFLDICKKCGKEIETLSKKQNIALMNQHNKIHRQKK